MRHHWIFLILILQWPLWSSAYFEFCHNSKPHRVKLESCEGGLFFIEPIDVECTYPPQLSYTTDVCTDEQYTHDPSGAMERQKLQYVIMNDDDAPTEPTEEPYATEGCLSICGTDSLGGSISQSNFFQFDSSTAPLPQAPDSTTYTAAEERENTVDGVISDDKNVKEQTERLFLYLSGLIVDEGENGPNTRLAKIMRLSFEVFRQHCPQDFVSKSFSMELEKAFFYLLREGDLGRMHDLSEEDYEDIKGALESCKHQKPTTFKLGGTVCEAKAYVQNITSTMIDLTVKYRRTPDSFTWGQYDVPVDSSWQVGDFVHGLCYGKFSKNVNKHHQYEVAMESLFTNELIYRWERPFKLGFPEAWDHLLQTNMQDTMRNIDACVQGAYLGSPFLRRLQRPMVKAEMADSSASSDDVLRRKKREASDIGDWFGRAFCFSSMSEATEYLQQVRANCSEGSDGNFR